MVFLVGGNLSDLVIPMFIGKVIDLLEKDEIDEINDLCLYMLIIIFVSLSNQICGSEYYFLMLLLMACKLFEYRCRESVSV